MKKSRKLFVLGVKEVAIGTAMLDNLNRPILRFSHLLEPATGDITSSTPTKKDVTIYFENLEGLEVLEKAVAKCRKMLEDIEVEEINEFFNIYPPGEKKEPILLHNSIMTPDGTILVSRHRHDFVEHLDKNGKTYFLDGGLDYRRIGGDNDYEDLAVYSTDEFEKIRCVLERGSRGKNFNKPLRWVRLKDMSDNWLSALLEWLYENQPDNQYRQYYEWELYYRQQNNITVDDDGY